MQRNAQDRHDTMDRNTMQRNTTQCNTTELTSTQQNRKQKPRTYAKQTCWGNVELDQKLHRKKTVKKTLQVYVTISNYSPKWRWIVVDIYLHWHWGEQLFKYIPNQWTANTKVVPFFWEMRENLWQNPEKCQEVNSRCYPSVCVANQSMQKTLSTGFVYTNGGYLLWTIQVDTSK